MPHPVDAFLHELSNHSTAGIVLLVATALIAGLSRGFSGFGSGLIFIPLAGMIVGPKAAAPLLLMIDFVGALPTVRPAWRPSEKLPVALMAGGAAIGMPIGILVLLHADPILLRWLICTLISGVLILMISGRHYTGAMTPPVFGGVGVMAGIMTGVAQIGGPPIVAFWLGSTRPLGVVRANIMLYFALNALVSVFAYAFSGLLTQSVAILALIAGPAYFIGVLCGIRLYPLASQQVFRKISLALIGLAVVLSMPAVDSLYHP
ncbi:sulfite exporter TauE/SafE family protein [Shinella sp. S4-D37]|uniref:sulfite exporter TauE/SafE family protein n=1 Tax=Shinella sp. S4-D37 TaxID=3161999 RepID=UPI00346512DC